MQISVLKAAALALLGAVCAIAPAQTPTPQYQKNLPGVATDNANGVAITGSVKAGKVNSSVNTQINVMAPPFNATGDCSTDDSAAITAAQTAALAYVGTNSMPAAVYFPKPPGGCYKTSTIQYQGVCFLGQPAGNGVNTPQAYGVTLKGFPGQDILHIPDPYLTSSYTFWNSWCMHDIAFVYDTHALASSSSATTTNNSTTLTLGGTRTGTPAVGQAVIGAGIPAGTTVMAYSNPTVTLSANAMASATVSVNFVANFPHRWPGRWFDDGAMTASSATFATSSGQINCSDIGQAIIVNGAGATVATTTLTSAITTTTQTSIAIAGATTVAWAPISGYIKVDSEIMMYVGTQAAGLTTITVMRGQAGTTAATHSNGATVTVMGNLTTTISNVDPCFANGSSATTWKVITLAATASTTVSSAHSYVSILDFPASQTVGNAAIAFDNIDAKSSDWPNINASVGSLQSHMSNVTFNSVGGTATNGAAFFSQGVWGFYGGTFRDIGVYSSEFGIVDSAPAEINSYYSAFGDFQDWDHLNFTTNAYPWISYNGGECKFRNVEITAFAGPQFMSLSNQFADVGGWDLNIQEMESWNSVNDTRFGLRISGGTGYTLSSSAMSMAADATNKAWIDTTNLNCIAYGCYADAGGINLYGSGNILGSEAGSPVVDKGRGNQVANYYNASPRNGQPAPYFNTLIPQKGQPNLIGASEPDYIADGYPATPYRHEDFWFWPQDWFTGTPGTDLWSALYQDDANALTGHEIFLHAGFNLTSWVQFNKTGGNVLTIGTNMPAAQGTLYINYKCATATTTALGLTTTGGYTVGSGSVSCTTTTLQTTAIPFNLVGQTGNVGIKNFGSAGQDVWVAWAYLAIAPQLPAGTTIGGVAPGSGLGPTSGTAAGELPCFTNTVGVFNVCNAAAGFSANITAATGFTFMVKSTQATSAGSAILKADKGNSAASAETRLADNGTTKWDVGMVTTDDYSIKDSVNGHFIVVLPSNTMPNSSIGGNANGATAITQTASDNTTNIATDAFVHAQFGKSTLTVPTTLVAANSCNTGTAVTITGIASTSALSWPSPNADPTAVTGFTPTATTLYFVVWPTANTYNWKICNPTGSSITPSASTTWNIGAIF